MAVPDILFHPLGISLDNLNLFFTDQNEYEEEDHWAKNSIDIIDSILSLSILYLFW